MNSSLICEACMRSCETSQVTVFEIIFSSFFYHLNHVSRSIKFWLGIANEVADYSTAYLFKIPFSYNLTTRLRSQIANIVSLKEFLYLLMLNSIFYLLFYAACSEAYGSAISAIKACFDGCTNAQQEYHTRSVVINNNLNFQINKRPMSPFL